MQPLDLLLLSLAAWRVAYFIVREDGPGRAMGRIRARLGGATACMYCASVYAAATAYVLYLAAPWVMWVIAVSGGAMMLHRYTGSDHT